MTGKPVFTRVAISATNTATPRAWKPDDRRKRRDVTAGGKYSRIDDVHALAERTHAWASPAARTFLTQSVLPWPSTIASSLPVR